METVPFFFLESNYEVLVISAISQTDSWSLQAGLVLFSSPAHLSGKEPYNECLQGAGNRVNIGVINYKARMRWQSNPMIIVPVKMRSRVHAQRHDATDKGMKKKKHILCPLTLSFCRAADRQRRSLLTLCLGGDIERRYRERENKRNGEKRHFNDTVIIKDACAESKGW